MTVLHTVRSRYKRQLIQFKMIKKWPTWSGMEDSRPIFSCKRFSYNENALYLFAKKTTFYVSCSTMSPFFSSLVDIGMVWSPPCSSLACGPKRKEHTARPGQTRPTHHFFRETRSWCSEGSWEGNSESLIVQTLPSFCFRPSKFTVTRYTAISRRCRTRLLANLLCSLAVIHRILSIEPKTPHRHCHRIPTARCVLSANPATPVSLVRVPSAGAMRPNHSRPSHTVPGYPLPFIAVGQDPL